MFDGLYQSAICYFMTYLLFAPATFETESGLGVADRNRMGVYACCVSILVINSYILLNTYKWDWIILLVTAISTLFVWAWTGIYSSFEASFQFYKAGAEVYSTLTFWALTLLIWVTALLPRFAIKFFQKNYRPYDVDVVRERVRQGKYDYLDQYEAYVPPKAIESSGTSSEQPADTAVEPVKSRHLRDPSTSESQRPIYPPSEAPTRDTKHAQSQAGSDGTDKTRPSFDVNRMGTRPEHTQSPASPVDRMRAPAPPARPSMDRMRSSFERSRQSYERGRSSFEQSRDFSSAAFLTRMESSHSHGATLTPTATSSRRRDITAELTDGPD